MWIRYGNGSMLNLNEIITVEKDELLVGKEKKSFIIYVDILGRHLRQEFDSVKTRNAFYKNIFDHLTKEFYGIARST